ncbi:hypothetical protein SNE25_12910 [Mucilaginibacter sabulilitoris]|uniref:Uncharacterized protein n=1 Tax=Mucilaginibacter sabulilitoris TaxID=1173583 RepID=A0ABZ0TTI5_9SPHI|nr:hypothetical protein [Mucilaginibacter sabulilitoris]WPU96420.1 hypothetical protein SNE25_12910 [Mucilaginibacter sabulilitoris]
MSCRGTAGTSAKRRAGFLAALIIRRMAFLNGDMHDIRDHIFPVLAGQDGQQDKVYAEYESDVSHSMAKIANNIAIANRL